MKTMIYQFKVEIKYLYINGKKNNLNIEKKKIFYIFSHNIKLRHFSPQFDLFESYTIMRDIFNIFWKIT